MRVAIFLGLRLGVGTGSQRARSAAMVLASVVSTSVLLLVWGIAHSRVGTTKAFPFDPGAVRLLVAGTIGMVALPVLVFVATIARLSARVRDRRLANLRLLGASVAQIRVVAAAEVGFASMLGSVLAVGAVAIAAVLVPRIDAMSTSSTSFLVPPVLAWIVAPIAVPAIAVMTAAAPQGLASARALKQVRTRDARPVRLIRLIPLTLGFGLCWATRSPLVDRRATLPSVEVVAIVAGIGLLAIGMLLVVPVFVTLMATFVLRLGRNPLFTLVGRRLQTQPSGATRVIAVLMLGLFIVVGARGVVAAFLSTPQYLHAADFVEREQTAEVTATHADAASTASVLRSLHGVQAVKSFPVLRGEAAGLATVGEADVTVLVASCTDLETTNTGRLAGCSDKAPNLVGDPWFSQSDVNAIRVQQSTGFAAQGAAVTVSLQGAATIDPAEFEDTVGALEGTPVVVVSPQTPGIARLEAGTDRLVVVHAGPGRFLYDSVQDAGFRINSSVDLDSYDFGQGMLALVWVLATLIIAIGLLTFTVAGIDRALSRRRELTALRLIGTPGRLLRTAQWWEAVLPTAFGSLLAIAAGGYAGATYLQLDHDRLMPLTTTATLAAIAMLTSLALAWITTFGTTARLDPEHIRSE